MSNAADPQHWRRKYVQAVQAGDAKVREITARLQPLEEHNEKLQRAYDGAAKKSDDHRRLLDKAKDREQTLVQDRQEALEVVVLLETKLEEITSAVGDIFDPTVVTPAAMKKLRALHEEWTK